MLISVHAYRVFKCVNVSLCVCMCAWWCIFIACIMRVLGVYVLCASCVYVCGFGVLLSVLCWKIASHHCSH
jgi:hypothetical protein